MSKDTGTRRREHDAERLSEQRSSVYAGRMYLGYTKREETTLGTMHAAYAATRPNQHLQLGHFDTQDDATDAVLVFGEDT